ncbi:DMT family transporter [Caldimonas mangrovi]|nr:DMT family transporter [Caldimonas mangrovi]
MDFANARRPGRTEWSDSTRGTALMAAGGVLLGTLGVFIEEAGQHPLTAVWFRCAFGVLALLAWGAWSGQLQELRLRGRALAVALTVGMLVVFNWGLFFAAIPRTSIAVATVAFHVQPVWVMVFGMLWLGEPVSPRRLAAVAVALAGLVLATGLAGGTGRPLDAGFLTGLACALGGSLSYAAVTLLAKLDRRIGSFALASWQCLVGTVLLAGWPWWHGWPAASPAWAWLAGLGVVHTALAYVVLYAGMRRLQAAQVALLQFVYPISAIVFDAAVYGRWLAPAQWIGVLMMGLALWAAHEAKPTQ